MPDAEVLPPAGPEASIEPPARAVMTPEVRVAPPTVEDPPEASPIVVAQTAALADPARPAASSPTPTHAVLVPASRTRDAAEPAAGRGIAPAADRPDDGFRPTCTAAQLRRFIKSRPWVPMHELRRRFGINGSEDDVTPIRVGALRLYIGMPPAEGSMMAELLGSGDVGYELSLDPGAPIVVGVYPMRPVPRS